MSKQKTKLDWKEELEEKFGQYIVRYGIEADILIGDLGAIAKFWRIIGPMLLNEFEWKLDDYRDEGIKQELISIGDAMAADPKIDEKNENVQRILYIMDVFVRELNQEVDYSDEEIGTDHEATNQAPPTVDQGLST
jgi:hypothetical protein